MLASTDAGENGDATYTTEYIPLMRNLLKMECEKSQMQDKPIVGLGSDRVVMSFPADFDCMSVKIALLL